MSQALLSQHTGKAASALAFGVMQFGGPADAAESRALYDAARNAGISIFDAAYIYTEGAAETLLGEFAEAERDDVILISKCAFRPGMSVVEIRDQVETSLRRLRTECVDVLYLHRYPGDALLRETLSLMGELHREGKFTVLGASNFAAWEVMKAQRIAEQVGAPQFAILQPMYSLVKRQAEVEILPMAQRENLSVLPYSPLGGGILTGKYASGGAGRLTENEMYKSRYSANWMHDAAADFAALASDAGYSPAALAVAWVAHNPAISAPITSARSVVQLKDSLDAGKVNMTPELYARVSAITPTPPPATDRLEESNSG